MGQCGSFMSSGLPDFLQPHQTTHPGAVQAECAAQGPGLHLGGQREGQRVPVGQLPPSPGLCGTHGHSRGFGDGSGRPQVALAVGRQRGWLVPAGTVPRGAGQGPALRAALGAQGGRAVRRRRRGQVPERGWDGQRFVLVQSSRCSLRGGGMKSTA